MPNIISEIRKFTAGDSFLAAYIERNLSTAKAIVSELARVNGEAGFHAWKDDSLRVAKARLEDANETWQALTIHAAYEAFKVQQSRPWYRKLFGWLGKAQAFLVRNGLDGFVRQHTAELIAAIPGILSTETNADVKVVADKLWGIIDGKRKEAAGNWKSWVIQLAINAALKNGILPTEPPAA